MTNLSIHPALESALKMIAKSAQPVSFDIPARLSLIAERIARELAVAAAIEAALTPAEWEDLPQMFRERMKELAERAINMIDLHHRIDAAHRAAEDTELWLNGPGSQKGTEPTGAEIAAKAIGFYEARLHEVVR